MLPPKKILKEDFLPRGGMMAREAGGKLMVGNGIDSWVWCRNPMGLFGGKQTLI